MRLTGILSILAGLLLSACDTGPCHRACPAISQQLIRDLGVKPEDANCNDPKWTQAQTCAECDAMLQRDYGVTSTQCR